MKTLKQLLSGKHRPLAVVSPNDSVFHALRLMSDHDVGALLVLDGERLVGIFSERDYARKVILHGKASKDTPVSEIMTDKVFYVTPDRTVDECMAIMTEKHFRHLPSADRGLLLVSAAARRAPRPARARALKTGGGGPARGNFAGRAGRR